MLSSIKTDTLYVVTNPSKEIDITAIYDSVRADYSREAEYLRNLTYLFEMGRDDGDFLQWSTKRGSWVKRFSTRFYKDKGVKPNPDVLAVIGAKISKASPSAKKFTFMMCKPDWNRGDFADRGSCWFPKSYMLSLLLHSPKGFAFKFFKDEESAKKDSGHGIGRCWVDMHDEHMLIYNNRGPTLVSMARALSLHTGLPYTRIYGVTMTGGYTDGYGYFIGNDPPKHYNVEYKKEK